MNKNNFGILTAEDMDKEAQPIRNEWNSFSVPPISIKEQKRLKFESEKEKRKESAETWRISERIILKVGTADSIKTNLTCPQNPEGRSARESCALPKLYGL